ncbi:MAG: LysM peptidoglycan-binding domain-containing protein [Lentimicrobiaceae bacterium]|nr:LysM peptidoglycan-binding domain-containing protein [Lentimicrobiaceae bacterium]
MKITKTIISFLLMFLLMMLAPTLKAQESLKSNVITEYNGKKYYLHTVKKKQTLDEIAAIYGVRTYDILLENKDIKKKNIKTGTIIRIPYTEIIEEIVDNPIDIVEEDTIASQQEYYPINFDSDRLYRMALMMPLYLENVDEKFLNEDVSNKLLLNKSFSYLHFYEGFMIAVDSMLNKYDLKLELKVYDIDQDTTKLSQALNDSWLTTVDVIVGPFHLKPFEKVLNFASEHDILIVNPMTNREDLLIHKKNMVKVKPSYSFQMPRLEELIKENYYDNNIFILAMDNSNMEYVKMIEEIALRSVQEYSLVPNKIIKNVITKQYEAWTREEIEFADSVFYSDNMNFDLNYFKLFPDDSTKLRNHVFVYDYSVDSLHGVNKMASTFRNNLVIVYGDSRVFATEMVNKVNTLTAKFPINMIALPDWSKYDRLFNENLMNMSTVYFDEEYTDYNSYSVGKFICKFRDQYGTEPGDMAFHGFNIGWYFLNALMNYGDNLEDAITTYRLQLLNTKYNFDRKSPNDGAENTYWNVYRYNKSKYEKELLPSD